MTVNQEIKGNLAKLLATENLIVEHRKVSTACFDVDRRVLTLPIWNNASATVYDMLVGHEVGHALYTPNEDWRERCDAPQDFVNIIEDARIEKLMKRKFPGLARSFYTGYKELNDDDFFALKEVNIAELSLIDRINLHFKMGFLSYVPFDEEELPFIEMTAVAETFDEVLNICSKLVEFLKKKEEEQPEETPDDQDSDDTTQDNGTSEDEQEEEQNEGESDDNPTQDNSTQENNGTKTSGGGRAGGAPNETESKTQRSFDKNSENLSKPDPFNSDTNYVEVPDLNLNKIVVDWKDLHQHISKSWKDQFAEKQKHWGDLFEAADSTYNTYKSSAQKEVNYLVKEFECKKSADSYARSSTSRTGVLDTKMLHTYKYADDIFRKVTVIPDGKNHGLIFILDWSGSMNNTILDTVKQLLNLCWFCRKVQIPFEVYSFSYEWSPLILDAEYDSTLNKTERVAGQFDIHRLFALLNFLSSRSNNVQFEEQVLNVWRLAYYMSGTHVTYTCPIGLEMSGTPLNESIIALHKIIPQFKENNKLQKVNVVILTDGEGNNLTYNVNIERLNRSYIGQNHVNSSCALRDRKTGHVYRKFGLEYENSLTAILLENLRHRFPEVNLIGFRILGGSEFNRFYSNLKNIRIYEMPENVTKQWRKEKSYEIDAVGYNSLYAISSSGISSEAEFTVSEDASTAEISKAFRGMLKKKTMNKKILSSFASLVS
jgi:hypothetical protein